MGAILTVAAKDLRLLSRDRMGLFWVLGFPLLISILFGAMFKGATASSPLPVLWVDEDDTALSHALGELLRASPSLRLSTATHAEAQEHVRTRRSVAFVRVPSGFELRSGLGSSEGPEFEIGLDPARRAETGQVRGLLMEAYAKLLRARLSDPEQFRTLVEGARMGVRLSDSLERGQRANALQFLTALDAFLEKVDKPLYQRTLAGQNATVTIKTIDGGLAATPFEVTFPSGMVWGLIGCVATFSLALVRERVSGTHLRLRMAPVGTAAILLGKALACLSACGAMLVLLTTVGVLGFGVRLTCPGLALLAMFSAAVCFTGLTLLISTLGKTESAVAGAGWAILMVLAMFGGAMMPLYFMPEWMLTLSNISPVKWSIQALEGALWRGYSLQELLPACASLLALGAGAFGAGVVLSRRVE